jgi:hypothetical protein
MGGPLFGQEHVDRYRETDGEDGHDWQGATVLLLTTTGRKSGKKRTMPLVYQRLGDDYLLVASNGGAPPLVPKSASGSDRRPASQGRPSHRPGVNRQR